MPYQFSMPMRKYVWRNWTLHLLSIIALSSCDLAFGLNNLDYSRLDTDLDTAWRKTTSYRYILDAQDQWKSPKEFEADGGGDCEDFAIYLMYHLGDTSALYIVKLRDLGTYHAIVRYRGQYLEPQILNRVYDPDEFIVIYQMTYVASMFYGTNGGSKSIQASNPYSKTDLSEARQSQGCQVCYLNALEWPEPGVVPVSS